MDFFKPKLLFLELLVFILVVASLDGCSSNSNSDATPPNQPEIDNPIEEDNEEAEIQPFYLGADLSYVNEIEHFGAEFRRDGALIDPFELFSDKGCNLVRLRLWNNPPTGYSDFKDVKKSIQRAKKHHMQVLLDFHYSDFWADPHKQTIPNAWKHITDTQTLADSVYQYTYNTLLALVEADLTPELVQIGNETNIEILQLEDRTNTSTINWERNSTLFNAGIKAVNDLNREQQTSIKKVLHIAQPENAIPWFKQAALYNLTDFDIIGLSYYPKWSSYALNSIPSAISQLSNTYNKPVLIVETGYPYSLDNVDAANNILGEDALIEGYPATPEGQLNYLVQLTKHVKQANGLGVIYWEPAWITSNAETAWGKGSHWDNVTFFDAFNQNEALPAFDFFDQSQY